MKLTIKNSEWLRGEGNADSCYDQNGCYCVMGLMARTKHPEALRFGEIIDADVVMRDIERNTKAIEINDDCNTTDAEKIELLKPIFAAHGVEIEYREDL